MNRLLSILVTLFILFLVYLWINHLTGKNDANGLDVPDSELTFSDDSAEEDVADLPQEQVGQTEEDDAVGQEVVQEKKPEAAEEKREEAKPKPKPKPTPAPVEKKPTPPPTQNTIEATGLHLVIAGNFLTRANAEERVRQLHKLGYPDAEVVNFELSEYHTACAGRFKDLNEARRISKKIKETHGIDTYVRLGN